MLSLRDRSSVSGEVNGRSTHNEHCSRQWECPRNAKCTLYLAVWSVLALTYHRLLYRLFAGTHCSYNDNMLLNTLIQLLYCNN